jgi:hypothetical protein
MYPIYNQKQHYRLRDQYIVLAHIRDFWKIGSFVAPHAKRNSLHYTWGLWQKYFYGELQKKELPMHYFTELLDDDWVIYQGLNFTQQSWFMSDLVNSLVVPFRYMDAIVIAIGDDYTIDSTSPRMIDHLSDKLISALMREYTIPLDHIVTLDEILVSDWKLYLKDSGLNYDITPMSLFNKEIFEVNLKRYLKK